MSLRTMANYFEIGKEPYTVPTSTQPQTFNYPVVANSDITMNNPVVANKTITLKSGNLSNLISTTSDGSLFLDANYGGTVPVGNDIDQGLKITWNIDGGGVSSLLNCPQNGSGGFSLGSIAKFGPILPLASFIPYRLPNFTYGPVCYGYVPATFSGSSLSLPYFISGGFTITKLGTGSYQITFPRDLANVTCQCTTVGAMGIPVGGITVQQPDNTQNQLIIDSFRVQDSNIIYTVPQDVSFSFTINAGIITNEI